MKRNYILIIVISLTISSAFSQGLNFATGEFDDQSGYYSSNIFDTILVDQAYDPFTPPDSIFNHYDIQLIPFEDQEVLDSSFRFVLITNTIPVEWHYQVCNIVTCWSNNTWWPDYEVIVDENSAAYYWFGYETWSLKVYPNGYPANAEVKVYIYKNGETTVSDSIDLKFEYSDVTAINEPDSEQEIDFNIYPNPASENVFIEFQKMAEIDKISIIDMSGKIVESFFPGVKKSIEIDISKYPKGIYFARCDIKNHEVIMKKLVVN